MSVMTAPHISEVNPNAPIFRMALGKADGILAGTDVGAGSRHSHFEIDDDQVLFMEPVTADELAVYLVSRDEAIRNGLPSCWGVAEDGLVVLSLAERSLHAGSGVDVTSAQFLERLEQMGRDFATANLHQILELTVVHRLFAIDLGEVAMEVTDVETKRQRMTRMPTPAAVADGDWAIASRWRFPRSGGPVVTTTCSMGDESWTHTRITP